MATKRKTRMRAAESAAAHLLEPVPQASAHERAGEVLRRLQGGPALTEPDVYVLDDVGRLQGVVPLGDLLRLPPETPIEKAMRPAAPVVSPELDQERVASVALRHDAIAIPVANREGRFLGVVPTRALMRILRHEHVEDLHRMAGITREATHARQALEAPPTRRMRDRLPWLLLGLLGSMLATAVVDGFAHTLEMQVALAFFMPGLVYLTDAIGTQSEAIAVRGLSTTRFGPARLLLGELKTGLLLGAVLGGLVFGAVSLFYRDLRLASAVAFTVLAAGLTACTVGTGLPWLLGRLGVDPAFGSGPLGTIIQDVLTLLIYFLAITWMM